MTRGAQHDGLALAALVLGVTALVWAPGCTFYTDSINGEPSAAIVKETPGPHFIDNPVRLRVNATDPNDSFDVLVARWTASRCNDAAGTDCPDEIDLRERGVTDPFDITIDAKQPVLIELEVLDDRGAFDYDSLVIEVQNQAPEIELQLQGHQVGDGYPLGTWIDILAMASDADGDDLDLTWELFPPDASVPEDVELTEQPDLGLPARRLTPDVPGLWTVRVTATDPDGGETSEEIPILVTPDAPPCIANIDPTVPGATYIVDADDDPRRFAVLSVTDDLDPYPAPADPGDFLGEATFRWQIASPDTGGVFTEVAGHELADYFLDPANFSPGDQIDLRVETADRTSRTIDCPIDQPTCSIDSDGCLQRITWGVEIR